MGSRQVHGNLRADQRDAVFGFQRGLVQAMVPRAEGVCAAESMLSEATDRADCRFDSPEDGITSRVAFGGIFDLETGSA